MQRVTGIFTKQSTRAAGTTYRSGSIFWDKAVKEGNSSRQKSQLSAELSEDATDDVSLHGQRGGGGIASLILCPRNTPWSTCTFQKATDTETDCHCWYSGRS